MVQKLSTTPIDKIDMIIKLLIALLIRSLFLNQDSHLVFFRDFLE